MNAPDASPEYLNQISLRFQDEWSVGDSPVVESFLHEVPEGSRLQLLRELLTIELSFRRQRGESPAIDKYLSRFPDFANVVTRCFGANESVETQAEPAPSADTIPQHFSEVRSTLSTHPTELENFRILSQIGEGGMGYVYEAEDIRLNRHVALKVMKRHIAASQAARTRFIREGQSMASLQSDYIVPVYQVGESEGIPYIAMPLLQGETVESRVHRSGGFSSPGLLQLAKEVATGLSTAHAAGLIHRDIKPSNLWLEQPHDRVKILDFGLARIMDDQQALTATGSFLGTPAFMSPEQADGLPTDERSDLFSVGCVLYFAATGTPPFKRPTLTATLHAIAYDSLPPANELNEGLTDSLSDCILWLLSKSPDDRPASAAKLLSQLNDGKRKVPLIRDLPATTRSYSGQPHIHVDISEFLETEEPLLLNYEKMKRVQDFITQVYIAIRSKVAIDSYGRKWILVNQDTEEVIPGTTMRGRYPRDDKRPLTDAAILPGTKWAAIRRVAE